MKQNFKPKIINLEEDALLLEVPRGQLDKHSHLLNWRDRKGVHDILEYVQAGGLDTYIGGGVVQNHLKGIKVYGDIDLLAVGNQIELGEVVHPILRAKNNSTSFNTYDSKFDVDFKFLNE